MDQVLREVGIIARALDYIANAEFKEWHLHRGQYVYLVRIVEHPGIIANKLAELIQVDRTTTNRAVSKLEEQGLVERKADEVNRKIKKIYPTLKGKELAQIILREHLYSNAQTLQGFTEEEALLFLNFLKRARYNVQQDLDAVRKGKKREY